MTRPRRKNTASAEKKSDNNKTIEVESCRICMTKNVVLISIFGSKSGNIAEEIHYCTGVLVKKKESLPTKICCSCLNNLTIAHTFKQLCLATDDLLKKLKSDVKTEIKEEIIDKDDDDDGWNDDDDDWKLCEFKKEESKSDIEEEITKTTIIKTKGVKSKDTKRKNKEASPKEKLTKIKKYVNPCSRCNIDFSTRKLLIEHNTNIHNEQETYICDICAKIYYKLAAFDSHVRSHNPPKYFCDQCIYSSSCKTSFTRHISIHSEVKNVQCDKCERAFHNTAVMRAHYRRVHENKKKIVNCPRCNRLFHCNSKLKRHIDTHDNIKRYQCELCPHKFARREFWKKHLLSEHDITVAPVRPGPRLPFINEEFSFNTSD